MLYDMLADTADAYPNNIAIAAGDRQLAYAALRDQVDAFADDLMTLGLTPGQPAILLLPNGVELAVATFAIARLGGIVVPLNTAFGSDELGLYLADSGAELLITTTALAERHVGLLDQVEQRCRVITEVLQTRDARTRASAAEVAPTAPVLYQYSSGSTGTPKRVVRSHENLLAEADAYRARVAVTADDRILCAVPMFHSHGFGNGLLAAVRAGATLLVLPTFTREGAMEALLGQRATIFPGVPFMFSILADSAAIAAVALPHLRLAFSAGAPLSAKVHRGFRDKFGVPVRQLYGSTETGAVAINLGATDGEQWASVGRPLPGIEVKLVDDDGVPVPPGADGEILIRGKQMTAGYAGHEDLNAQVFRDGWFHTGDLASADGDGNLFLHGRKTAFINVGANKVDPAEIEAALAAHPRVREAVVVGIPGPYGDELVKAVVVADAPLNEAAVKAWCGDRLAGFKVPRVVELRDEIPRSPLGKILKKYLVQPPEPPQESKVQ